MAARAGQVEVVRCLLRNGALVDARARVGAGAWGSYVHELHLQEVSIIHVLGMKEVPWTVNESINSITVFQAKKKWHSKHTQWKIHPNSTNINI